MKKYLSAFFLLLLLTAFLASALSSCYYGRTLSMEGGIYTDNEGVYITIDSFTEGEDGRTVSVTWHNETERTVCFGLGYTVERLEGEEWVKTQVKDFAVPEIACILDPEKTAEQVYKLKYFNLYKQGKYRLYVNYYLQTDENSDSVMGEAYAEFSVISSADAERGAKP